MSRIIPLSQLLTELARAFPGRPLVNYRQLYDMVLSAKLPATNVNGRWTVEPDDLPVIAQILGMEPPAPASDTIRQEV